MAHTSLPTDLPVPQDDGACSHLAGWQLPSVILTTTSGAQVDLSALSGLTVLFCYPRTGAPDEEIPYDWNIIPGARGCTPQACSFRDQITKLRELGVSHLYGLSTQDSPYQREVKERVHLPYDLLSDDKLVFTRALKLPIFEWQGKSLIKRCAFAIEDGVIVKVWYPVFPPDKSANDVVEWLESKQ